MSSHRPEFESESASGIATASSFSLRLLKARMDSARQGDQAHESSNEPWLGYECALPFLTPEMGGERVSG